MTKTFYCGFNLYPTENGKSWNMEESYVSENIKEMKFYTHVFAFDVKLPEVSNNVVPKFKLVPK